MTTHESLKALAVGEFHVEHAAVCFDQTKGVELALIALLVERAEVTPVDLEALTGGRLHTHERARCGRRPPRLLQVLAQDAVAARIASRLQALEDDAARSARVSLQQRGDERLEGIELAGAGPMNGQGHEREEILFNGASAQVEMTSDTAHERPTRGLRPCQNHLSSQRGLSHASLPSEASPGLASVAKGTQESLV